jgi:hypothetical protein
MAFSDWPNAETIKASRPVNSIVFIVFNSKINQFVQIDKKVKMIFDKFLNLIITTLCWLLGGGIRDLDLGLPVT